MNLSNAEGGQAGEKSLFLFRENKSAELPERWEGTRAPVTTLR